MSGNPKGRFFPLLRLHERVRLAPDGPVYRVVRVTDGAAYLKLVYQEPVEVVLPNGRSFLAHEGGGAFIVAPRAAVYRMEA